MPNIPINSGTGPRIAVDTIGTSNFQVVKVMQAVDGATTALSNVWQMTNTGTSTVVVASITTGTVTVIGLTVGSITTGTVNVVNVLSASGVTIASITTGTVNVVNVLSASGVTVANITTGTVNVPVVGLITTGFISVLNMVTGTTNVVNTVTITGSASMSGTGNVTIAGTPTITVSNNPVFVQPTTASNLNGFAVNTNSSNTICITSGAYTIYVTDLLVSVNVPMNVTFFSAATTKAQVYLASQGGFTMGLTSPMKLNSNQSLTFTPSVSGSCSVFAAGFSTV